jgi:protein-tyrosine-phosphatase
MNPARSFGPALVGRSDVVVTMGCGVDSEQCPSIRSKDLVDWRLPDAGGMSIEDVRGLRETIRRQVEVLLDSFDLGARASRPSQS